MKTKSRATEYTVAVASFVAAVALAFTSLILSDGHEVAAGNCTLVAQFLLLTASIFGIDYKLNHYGTTNPDKRNHHPLHGESSRVQNDDAGFSPSASGEGI